MFVQQNVKCQMSNVIENEIAAVNPVISTVLKVAENQMAQLDFPFVLATDSWSWSLLTNFR